MTTYHSVDLPSGASVAYVESGDPHPTKPTLLLLHGFPSSSNQFRNLIPLLSETYHIIAPDLPFFGHTIVPNTTEATFATLTNVLAEFLDKLTITSFIAYVFDYGAPTAYRLALDRPEAFKGLIVQNGNAYEEGLSAWWDPLRAHWATTKGSEAYEATRMQLRGALSLDEAKTQYLTGLTPELISNVDPNAYTLDYLVNMSSEEKAAKQLDLFYDYQNNVKLYPQFQEFFRDSQIPTLVVWGAKDLAFSVPGAHAYERDLPNARVEIVEEGSHFLLETHVGKVADLIKEHF